MALLTISTEDDDSNLEEPPVKKQKGQPAFSTKVEYEANILNTIALTQTQGYWSSIPLQIFTFSYKIYMDC